jgi:hypothetical protein
VTLSDTLKKSIASQVQASHLHCFPPRQIERAQLALNGVSRESNIPREELRPLDPCERTKDLEKRPSICITRFASWNEIAEEVGRHRGREEAMGGAAGEKERASEHLDIYILDSWWERSSSSKGLAVVEHFARVQSFRRLMILRRPIASPGSYHNDRKKVSLVPRRVTRGRGRRGEVE